MGQLESVLPGGAATTTARRGRPGGRVLAPAMFALRVPSGRAAVALLRVEGRFDESACGALRDMVERLCRARVPRFVLDLSGVRGMSSGAAAACVLAIGTARSQDGNVVLLRPAPAVRDVFDVLGLTAMFPVAADLAGAIAAIGDAPADPPSARAPGGR